MLLDYHQFPRGGICTTGTLGREKDDRYLRVARHLVPAERLNPQCRISCIKDTFFQLLLYLM